MELWLARDADGALFLYDTKPIKSRGRFTGELFNHSYRIATSEFPEVTYENSPQKVELKLI